MEGSMQDWMRSGYPDKEFHALDAVLAGIKGQNDQNGRKRPSQDLANTRASTSSLKRSLSFCDIVAGECERAPTAGDKRVHGAHALSADVGLALQPSKSVEAAAAVTTTAAANAPAPAHAANALAVEGATAAAPAAAHAPAHMHAANASVSALPPGVPANALKPSSALTRTTPTALTPNHVFKTFTAPSGGPTLSNSKPPIHGRSFFTTTPLSNPSSSRSSWNTLPDTMDNIMHADRAPPPASKARKPPARSRRVSHINHDSRTFRVMASEATPPMHAQQIIPSAVPQQAATPVVPAARTSADMVAGMRKTSSERDLIAAQFHNTVDELVEAIAAHAAAEAVRTQTSLLHHNHVFTNSLLALMQQDELNVSTSQRDTALPSFPAGTSHRDNLTKLTNSSQCEVQELVSVSDPGRFPASLVQTQDGSGYVSSAALDRKNSAFKPVRKAVSTGVQLPMPFQATVGFPCAGVGASTAPVDASAGVSTGAANMHACAAAPPLLHSAHWFASNHPADGGAGVHASLDTGSRGSADVAGHPFPALHGQVSPQQVCVFFLTCGCACRFKNAFFRTLLQNLYCHQHLAFQCGLSVRFAHFLIRSLMLDISSTFFCI